MNTPIYYRITPVHPEAHLFEVSCTVGPSKQSSRLRLALPSWIPGSYMIREFARNIVEIRAETGRGKACRRLVLKKLDKHTWEVEPCRARVTITYTVYAWDLSVRCAHLDSTHGFFNGTGVFLRVQDYEHLPHILEIRKPPGSAYRNWRVATALQELQAPRHGFGTYRALNYDELVDHPVEMGNFVLASFNACGVPHDVVFTGHIPHLDTDRICTDLEKVCAAQIRFFEPTTARAPFDRYVFLVMAIGDGYGGLEHRASTALICKRDDLPVKKNSKAGELSDGYVSFLGLASHEYFHTWNVKRIKPASFAPYDLTTENYTSLLWIFEGFTSYYDDLFLVRTGLIDESRYLKTVAKTITAVLRGSGRTKQSIAESSFDAWIKYYRQDENSPNAIVSYYAKGSLVALALDLYLRSATAGVKSLDDVMCALWNRYGRNFYPAGTEGLGEDEFPAIVEEATGIDVSRQVRQWAYGRKDLPLKDLLGRFGIGLAAQSETPVPDLGVKLAATHGECRLAQVHDGGAAQAAGLSAGDILIALDGLRVRAENLESLLARYAIGDQIEALAFRRDELMHFSLTLKPDPAARISLTALSKGAGLKQRRAWLST